MSEEPRPHMKRAVLAGRNFKRTVSRRPQRRTGSDGAGADYDWSPFPQEIGRELASVAMAKHCEASLSVGLSTCRAMTARSVSAVQHRAEAVRTSNNR
jgi:hypothetical protein